MRYLSTFLVAFLFCGVASASTIDAFTSVTPLTIPTLKVPTLVHVPFSFGFDPNTTAALRKVGDTSDIFVPFAHDTTYVEGPAFSATVGDVDAPQIVDLSGQTDFELPYQPGENSVEIVLKTLAPIEASGIQIVYADFSSRPIEGAFRVVNASGEKTIRARSQMVGDTIRFPEERGAEWILTLFYTQPVRVSDVKLLPVRGGMRTDGIRFLAEPGVQYELFTAPDRGVYVQTTEMPNLIGETKVTGTVGVTTKNSAYVEADTDSDGIVDARDNCRTVSNSLQEDIDSNGVGDMCDDFDRDGYVSAKDNCPLITNGDQKDSDGDGMGDVCDGEESRPTEQYPWLPWVGIGFVVLVLIGMTALMMRHGASVTPPTE